MFALTGSVQIAGQQSQLRPPPLRVGGEIRSPRKLKNVYPQYPREAAAQGLEGYVLLEITIGPAGLVETVTVLKSVPGLDEAAIAAVRQWEFEPTLVRGEPVAVIATVGVPFSISKRLASLPQNEAETARAAELFQEVREAIGRLGPSRTSYGIDSTPHTAAGLFLELAKAEALVFSALAADDAVRAFQIAQSIAGSRRDVEDRQANDRDAVSLVLRWKDKTRIEVDAVATLISVDANARAIELARTGDVARAELFAPLILVMPPYRLTSLAAECRDADGTYPYNAMARRAHGIGGPAGEALVRDGLAALEDTSSFSGRSDGLEFIQDTYDLIPRPFAVRALLTLADRVSAQPKAVPGRGDPDSAVLGPKIVALLQLIDPAQAMVLATAHPEWRSSASAINRKPPPGAENGSRRSIQKSPPMMRLPPMSSKEFERTLSDTRRTALSSLKLQRLIALAYLLITEPPR